MRTRSQNRIRGLAMTSVAIAAIYQGPVTPTAQAQALQPVVDVCTGISLPRSAITEIIGAVNQPIVQQLESTVNGLTTVTLILAPLVTLPDLNIDLTTILEDAEEGDPISLQLLDTDGNVLTPADACNVTVDGVTLNDPAGLAIGGNQITGLGASGAVASAAEIDAIALGDNASTTAGATGAVAIGSGASATAANSVALGAGSIADRGAQTGYTAPGLAGTFDSAGTVSVGAPGTLRQITNLAPGSAATDAATVGQVTGAVAAATADSVQYDDASHSVATLDGAGGTRLTNVTPGALNALSSDAVNGSQLFATNQQVATNTAAVATNTAGIAALQAGTVQYDDAAQTRVTLGGAGGTTLANVAAGALSATSTEAVNGSQLFATNQQVAANTSAISGLQASVGALGDAAVQYDDASHATVTFDGAAGTRLANVSAGAVSATSTDAVNGAQLFATNQQVATNTAGIAGLDTRVTTAEGNVTSLTARTTTNEGNITTLQGNVVSLDGRVTTNTTNIATLQQQLATAPARYVSDADRTTASATPTNTVRVYAANGGAATVTNVAPAALSASSTDAVNGSQLFATNQQVAQNTFDITVLENNLVGSEQVAIQYSNPDNPNFSNGGTVTNDVALIGANSAAPVALHNVANGTLATDAANLGQVQAGMAATLASARGYVDERFSALSFDLGELDERVTQLREDAFSGTASAMALSSIPQAMDAGGSTVGGGVGHYRGQTSFAVGVSHAFASGRAVVKAAGTMDSHGNGGFAAGGGFSF